MKLCKDCKHFSHISGTPYDACNHPERRGDPVAGRAFADHERLGGNCGIAGKNFEQKPPGFFKRLFG